MHNSEERYTHSGGPEIYKAGPRNGSGAIIIGGKDRDHTGSVPFEKLDGQALFGFAQAACLDVVEQVHSYLGIDPKSPKQDEARLVAALQVMTLITATMEAMIKRAAPEEIRYHLRAFLDQFSTHIDKTFLQPTPPQQPEDGQKA